MPSLAPISTLFLKHKQLFVFIMVGFMNTMIGYGLFSLFLYSGVYYITASFLATSIAVSISYHTTGKIVFKHVGSNVFLRYLTGCFINYLLNISLIKTGSLLYSNLYVVAALALLPNACFSYLFNKYVTFRRMDYE